MYKPPVSLVKNILSFSLSNSKLVYPAFPVFINIFNFGAFKSVTWNVISVEHEYKCQFLGSKAIPITLSVW